MGHPNWELLANAIEWCFYIAGWLFLVLIGIGVPVAIYLGGTEK